MKMAIFYERNDDRPVVLGHIQTHNVMEMIHPYRDFG